MSVPNIYKVTVSFKDDAHPPVITAVCGEKIRSAADAEAHCMRELHHMDPDTREIFPCVSAKRVRDEPFPPEQAPRVRSLHDAIRQAEEAG